MWTDLTDTPSYGDTFKLNYDTITTPDYLTSGQPCTDYSPPGSQAGEDGETGWMFTAQTAVINKIRPKAFRLEMAEHAINIHNGREVNKVVSDMKQHYVVKTDIIPVWRHGDPTARRRIFIVGFRRDLGPVAHTFKFPPYQFDEHNYPTFRSIAVPDDEVPAEYWRHDHPTRIEWRPIKAGLPHKIAQSGKGMGHSDNPHPILSWDGLGNSQTKYNGGGRRPRLDWQLNPTAPVGPTRLTVPVETVRAASISETYLDWCRQFNQDDRFLRECVNNGIPNRTSYAIDCAVMAVLKHPQEQSVPNHTHGTAMRARSKHIRSTMLDTGCNLRLHHTDIEPAIKRAKTSSYRIEVANKQTLNGSVDGTLRMKVINSTNQPELPEHTTIEQPVTTAAGISKELFTVDDLFRSGHSILLRNKNYQCGTTEIYKPPTNNTPEVRIPVRYDWDKSGFWLDYTVEDDTHTPYALFTYCYTSEQARRVTEAADNNDDITEIIYGQSTEGRNILGVKSGLRPRKAQLSKGDFHEEYGHLGSCPGCPICQRTQGAMRRITRVVDKHREQRRGHTWVMDGVTWSHRDIDGSKYMVTLRDKASNTFKNFYLYHRNHIREELRQWIIRMRTDPAYRNMGYLVISYIETDRAGEWSLQCEAWTDLETELQFRTIYKPSDRKEEAGTAERACGIMEVVTKASLMQNNLPPHWWVRAARQAEWLLNRFPVTSKDVSVPIDGDQARPLEILL